MKLQASVYSNRNLLAVPVGIKQKQNVDIMVQKVFLLLLRLFKLIKLNQHSLSNFIYFSFFEKTSQLFYSIMMALWMDG